MSSSKKAPRSSAKSSSSKSSESSRNRRSKRYSSYRVSFPKNTEVKSASKYFAGKLETVLATTEGYATDLAFTPGLCFMIGGSADNLFSLNIPQGTAINQRNGNKIDPVKLRISGSFSLENNVSLTGQASFAPNFWQVRCLVYQVIGGNSDKEVNSGDYHQLAMETSDGWLLPSQLRKLLIDYFNDGNATNDYPYYSRDHWTRNNVLAKCPLRRGIGGVFKVLHKQTFWINSQKNPIQQFRFITKTPSRLVYPESTARGSGDGSSNVCNNAIYIVWMFQPGSYEFNYNPRLNVSYNVDLFYTDK